MSFWCHRFDQNTSENPNLYPHQSRITYHTLPRTNFLKNNGPNFHLSAFCVWLSRDLCGSQLINAAHQHTPNLPRPWWYEFLISYKGVLNLSVNYYCGNCTMPVFNDFQILFIQRMGFNFSFEKLCVN